jgi:hypothetical protein
MNMPRQEIASMTKPEIAVSHSTVIGLPRIRIVFARPRSGFVNQWLTKITIAGSTAASTSPSRKRTAISASAELSTPCSEASTPQASRLQKIRVLTLRRSAKIAPGIWSTK